MVDCVNSWTIGVLCCCKSIFKDECIQPCLSCYVYCKKIPSHDQEKISELALRRLYRAFAGPKQTEAEIGERIIIGILIASGASNSASGFTPELGVALGCCCICCIRFYINAIKAEVRKWEENQTPPPGRLTPAPPVARMN